MQNETKILDYNSLLKISVISAITAVSASIIIFFFSNYSSLFFAYDFDIPASLDLSGIHFTSNSENQNWSRDAMITILLSKPISAFFGGMVFLVALMIGNKKSVTTILILFWLNIFAFNSAFSILIDDAILGIGTYEVATEMNIGNHYLIIMSVILAFFFYKIGMMNGRLIILSFPNQNLFLFKPRIIFFISAFIIPWILVITYTFFSTQGVFSVRKIIEIIPVIILLIPFLTAKKLENSKFNYLPSKSFSIMDIVLTVLFFTVSIALIIMMKNGIVIS